LEVSDYFFPDCCQISVIFIISFQEIQMNKNQIQELLEVSSFGTPGVGSGHVAPLSASAPSPSSVATGTASLSLHRPSFLPPSSLPRPSLVSPSCLPRPFLVPPLFLPRPSRPSLVPPSSLPRLPLVPPSSLPNPKKNPST
jgi:hypothetical protein